MKLLLNKDLTGLDGKEMPHANLGKLLANSLAGSNGAESIKYMDWALKFYNGEAVELDDTDYKKLYKEIEENKQFTRIVKSQILKEMERQKQVQPDKK